MGGRAQRGAPVPYWPGLATSPSHSTPETKLPQTLGSPENSDPVPISRSHLESAAVNPKMLYVSFFSFFPDKSAGKLRAAMQPSLSITSMSPPLASPLSPYYLGLEGGSDCPGLKSQHFPFHCETGSLHHSIFILKKCALLSLQPHVLRNTLVTLGIKGDVLLLYCMNGDTEVQQPE